MTEYQENYWWENVQQYLDIDHVLHVFPAPAGLKFNSKLKDSYTWAEKETRLNKEFLFQSDEYRGGNIGAACRDLVVVDLDNKNGLNGTKTWVSWLAGNPGTGSTWVSITPSGGAHVFFRLTEEQKARYQGSNRLRAVVGLGTKDSGVDIRTGRSHVMLPESTGGNGKRYRWSERYHPEKVKLAVAPEWLLKKISCGGELDKEFKQATRKHRKKRDGKLPHMRPEDMPKAVAHDKAGSGRDMMLHKAGSRWVTECEARVHMGEMTRDEARNFVWENMVEYNQKCTGGKPKEAAAVRRCFQSVMKYARRQWEAQADDVKEAVVMVIKEFPGAKAVEVITGSV